VCGAGGGRLEEMEEKCDAYAANFADVIVALRPPLVFYPHVVFYPEFGREM